MSWLWFKSRTVNLMEGALYLLDGAAVVGLVSGAAIVVALGKFFLGGVLGAFALGVVVRMTRRKKRKVSSTQEPTA